jgi:oxygen-independent coproporphyrinogen-3 oxidase
MYRDARELLLAEGFAQVSMRMFRRVDAGQVEGPVYCCQADGMVGLGCGARSYTERVHYASAYAVGAKGVRGILERYSALTEAEHARVDWGYVLDDEDRRRRFVILSLLSDEGLDLGAYRDRFASDAVEDLAELRAVLDAKLAEHTGARIRLTPLGLERCDRIGPALRSARVVARMHESALA